MNVRRNTLISLGIVSLMGCHAGEDLFADSREELKLVQPPIGHLPHPEPDPNEALPEAIAYPIAPVVDTPSPSGSSSSTGGPDQTLSGLRVRIGTKGLSCADPSEHVGDCDYGHLKFDLPLLAPLPGIYSLEELNGFFIESGPQEEEALCGGGGGTYWDGEVEITSVTDEAITGIVRGGASFYFDFSGPFVAYRCPAM